MFCTHKLEKLLKLCFSTGAAILDFNMQNCAGLLLIGQLKYLT